MSPDFRYHIASLAAVFLALGIGIVIGTAFVGAPVVDRQTRLIRHLEVNVKDLRRETQERQQTEEALRTLLPGVVRGKLAGRRVLVIQTGAFPDAANEAADALRLAGATVEQVALPSEGWRHPAPASDNAASPGPSPAVEDSGKAATEEARRLGPLLADAANTELEDFRQRGLLTGDASLSGPARYAVLIGGGAPGAGPNGAAPEPPEDPWATTAAQSRDLPLAEALTARGVTVIGAEPFDVGMSFMRTYQSAGLTTIDCVDRSAGKMALPFALLGEKGNFGMKPTADRVLPAALERPASQAAASATP